uniref:t-SNARE coiled-coil homology domain-containing protein n=1 Tax=Globodera pallida TaxID=36090 RepID=A0A183BRH1_GLOPA
MPGSTTGSTSSVGATAHPNINDEDTTVKVINKMLLQVKQANTTVRVEDLEKVFGEVIRLEEAINRALRNTNRKTYQCQTNISQLAGEINTGFQTMTAQITSLADKVSSLDRTVALLDEIAQGMRTLSVEMGKQKSINDVNAVVESTRATAQSKIYVKESASEAKPNIEPERISSWEKVSLGPKLLPLLPIITMINLLALLATSTAAALPTRPMICQTEMQPTLWSLPTPIDCPLPKEVVGHVPMIQVRELYIPNDLEHNNEAWACRKIKKRGQEIHHAFRSAGV